MRIRVLGNCQSDGLARCLGVMLPQAEVDHVFVDDPAEFDFSSMADQESTFLLHAGHRDIINASPLARAKNILYWPNIYFTAYHPDLVYARVGNHHLESPLHHYNSSLVLYAWMNRLDRTQAMSLFCDAVYERLGFYDHWAESQRSMIAAFEDVGLPFEAEMGRLAATGCFMHSTNHPKLRMLSVMARLLVDRMGLQPVTRAPHEFLYDNLAESAVWPVYPEIAEKLGIQGEYAFRRRAEDGQQKVSILSLEQFVDLSYSSYDREAAKGEVSCGRLQSQEERYRGIEALAARSHHGRRSNPYSGLPDHHFWRRAVETVPAEAVDPVVAAKFSISSQERVATAGSCFAQHIARTLVAEGFGYFVTENAPPGLTSQQALERNYGVFSARYGNVYTMRQMVQLIDRAYGRFQPVDEAWQRPDGRYVDPFRPLVEPAGFATPAEIAAARGGHFAAVRRMLEEAGVFIFTLGLTEAWRSRADGAVFPLAPGVAAGEPNAERYEFVNFDVADVQSDIAAFIDRIRAVNPAVRLIFTVSPVPLVATYERRHVLVSTTYSKSVLRSAVEAAAKRHDFVDYFPSYEVITGGFNRGRYFDQDVRSVTPQGVDHVMRLFRAHYLETRTSGDTEALRQEIAAGARIICDEEALDAPRAHPVREPDASSRPGWGQRLLQRLTSG